MARGQHVYRRYNPKSRGRDKKANWSTFDRIQSKNSEQYLEVQAGAHVKKFCFGEPRSKEYGWPNGNNVGWPRFQVHSQVHDLPAHPFAHHVKDAWNLQKDIVMSGFDAPQIPHSTFTPSLCYRHFLEAIADNLEDRARSANSQKEQEPLADAAKDILEVLKVGTGWWHALPTSLIHTNFCEGDASFVSVSVLCSTELQSRHAALLGCYIFQQILSWFPEVNSDAEIFAGKISWLWRRCFLWRSWRPWSFHSPSCTR